MDSSGAGTLWALEQIGWGCVFLVELTSLSAFFSAFMANLLAFFAPIFSLGPSSLSSLPALRRSVN